MRKTIICTLAILLLLSSTCMAGMQIGYVAYVNSLTKSIIVVNNFDQYTAGKLWYALPMPCEGDKVVGDFYSLWQQDWYFVRLDKIHTATVDEARMSRSEAIDWIENNEH